MRSCIAASVLVLAVGCSSNTPPPDLDGLWVLTRATIDGEAAEAPAGLRTVIEVRDTDLFGWSAPCAPMHGSLRDARGSWQPDVGGPANMAGCAGRDWQAEFAEAFNTTTFAAKGPDEMLFSGDGSDFGFERLDPIDRAIFGIEWRFARWSLPDVPNGLELDDFTATLRLDTDGTIELDTGCGVRTGTWEPHVDAVRVPLLEPTTTPCSSDIAADLVTLAGHIGNLGLGFRPVLVDNDELHLIPGPPGNDVVIYELSAPT